MTRRLRGKGAYYPGGLQQRILRGRGNFLGDVGNFFKKIPGPLFSAAGAVANTIWPGAGLVTEGIRKLVGAGAYTPVRSNAILAQPVPRVGSTQDVGITYSHCEFLGDITGSTDWELTQFHVNPGLPECFPWLSGVASNFQKYRIDGLVFYIRSTSSVAIADTQNLGLGTVLGGFQTNVYDKAPSSKLEFLSLSGARSGKPSEDHIFPMECDRSKNVFGNLLVRTVGVSDDLAKYDHAVFNLATVGFPGAYYLGELWVSYKLTLMAPKVESAVPAITTIPLKSADTPPVYTRNWQIASTYTAGGDDRLLYSPNLTDATNFQNYAGWSTGVGADGYVCTIIPSGTIGYYLVQLSIQNGAAQSGGVYAPSGLEFAVIDNSGTFEVDNTTIFGTNYSDVNEEKTYGFQEVAQVFHVQALPDKPMKVRVSALAPHAPYNYTWYSINVIRMPDKLFASNPSSTTVSLAQKVQRVMRSRASFAAEAERKVPIVQTESLKDSAARAPLINSQPEPDPAVPALVRQHAVQTSRGPQLPNR